MADYISKDGHLYTIDEVNQAAEENDTTFEDIIEKNGLSKNSKETPAEGPGKKKPVAVKDATVAGPKNTASKSVKSSSVSQDNPFGKVNIFDPLNITKNSLEAAKIQPKKEVKFNAKKFAKDMATDKTEGFYTKGEKNIEATGVKKKKAEEKVANEVFDTFDNFNYSKLTPEQKLSLDNKAADLLQSNIKIGESYSLSTKDIELKSQEILSKAAEKKKGIEQASYVDRFINGIAGGANYVGESFASIPETVYRVFALPQNIIASITDNKDLEATPEKLKKLTGTSNPLMDHFVEEQKKIQKNNNIYDSANYDSASISENISNGNWSDAFKLLGTGIAESAPVSIAMMIGGANMGLGKLAAASTGLMAGPESRKIAEENPNQSEIENVVTGFGMAAAESVFSAIGEGSLGKVYKDIVKKEGTEVGSKIFKDGLVSAYETALKKYGAPTAMVGEGLEEVATTITQNLISKKPAFENVTDSFIAGVGGGSVWGSPVNLQKGIQGFKKGLTTYKVNKELKNTNVNNLPEVFNPITPVTKEQINIATIPNSYKILNDQIDFDINSDKITPEQGEDIKKEFAFTYHAANKVKSLNMSEVDNIEVINLLKQRDKLNSTIKAVDDPTLTSFQNEEVKAINAKISEITTKASKQKIEEEVSALTSVVDKEGAKSYKNPLGEGKSFEVFETAEDAQSAYDKWAAENNKASEDITKTDGFVLPNGQILINKQRAAEVKALNVASHELLHNILKSEFSDPVKKVELKDSFLNVLSKAERAKLDERMLAYTAKELENAPDEYITQYFELLRNGDIKWSDNVKETLVGLWKNVLKPIFVKQGFKNIEFEDGRDIYNFVKEYAKTVNKGKVSGRAESLLKAGENISGVTKMSKTQSEIFKQELADLEEEYDEGYGDMPEEEYLPKKQSIENKIKTALKKESELKTEQPVVKKEILTEEDEVKEIIKENKSSVASDKVQKIYDTKGKEGAQDIIDLFKPITKKIVDKRRDAPDFDRELLTDEIETGVGGILDLITKYNPESGVPLAAYINKYLPVRAIATSKRLLGKEFSKDVTEEKALMAEETVSEVKEKPKYANALESKVFSKEALETINKKILSVVRTLKSKIDAPVSINRTVTPLIAEIRDEIGKQVDIDVKTAMGGKKDNQLKNWLLKNKKYILENMTTTWLMGLDGKGGIPQAIQKQIDGKWTNYPDWVGKKIDRESVSTDNAGRTSGAELVRRLPNVANNVSNEDFLSNVLEPSGNPIRGRKESLAKAIAEEASFDIVLDDFENQGPIFDAFITNQERLGVEIDDVLTTAFANQVERGNVKFSKSAVTNSMLFLLKENNWDFNSKELVDFKNSLDDKDQRYYTDFRKKWIRRVSNLLDEYKRIWESNAGVKFEAEAFNKLRKFSKNNPDFILNEAAPDKFNSRNPDLVYRVGKDGRNVIVELKADKTAPHGSTSNSNLLGDEIIFTKGFDGDTEMKSKMKDNESRQKALEYLKSNNLSKDGNSLIVSNEVWNNVKGEKTGPSMVITPKTLAQINVGKDIIHIQGNGSFTYEGSNTGELAKVPLINGNMYVYSRITSVASGKNRRIIERLFFQLGNNWDQKSDYNLIDNPEEFVNDSIKFSKTISPKFNKIIEENKGVEDYKSFSDIVARRRGIGKNKFDFYVPASAADFELLLYNFIGKGAKGEEQKKFFADTLLKPYANGNDLMDAARQSIKKEYKQLLNEFPDVAKKIEKRTPDGDFTYDQAIRVAMWNEEGVDIPGLSQRDSNKLTTLVNSDPELKAFKDSLIVTGRQGRGWIKPEQYWDANTIITDLHNLTEGEGRKKFLSEFIANAEEMFGKFENGKLVGPNINKVEAVYGTDVREALEDVLYRMITGKNKSFGKDKETSAWANWVSGSTGAIMFLNVRSAALQLIGAVNFLNLRDNNPYAAAKAFANQKQYWEDFATIWNSDKMKERRGGLKEDVAAAEIANAAEGSKNKVGAILSYLLKIGYTPTQMADSFAIASGGAPFYRNRIKSYLKEGMTEQEAEEAAWDDFTKVSDETQQSGDPRDISKQQASPAGRLLLTFQNTAMQQSRIVKKAVLDLKNGRGDAKTNFAKIAYYVAIQNTMFAVLQQGLFAVAFGDDDEDKEKSDKEKKLDDKLFDVADGVIDTILRGTGFVGGIVATVKNMAKKYLDERDKKFKADYAKVVLEAANLSPPIGSKLRKLYSGLQQTKFDKDLIEARGWDVTQDGRVNLSPSYGVAGKVVEATTNVPMDRLVTKINNASEALNSQNTAMQRIMVGLGWSPYSAGIEDSAGDKKIREEAKAKRKIEGVEKAKETRERTKDSIRSLPLAERIKLKRQAVADRREKRRRRKMG
jgi:hypothetical protein